MVAVPGLFSLFKDYLTLKKGGKNDIIEIVPTNPKIICYLDEFMISPS